MTTRTVGELVKYIYCNIEHGECLYDKEMFDNLIRDIDRLKSFCTIEFNNNQDPDGEE